MVVDLSVWRLIEKNALSSIVSPALLITESEQQEAGTRSRSKQTGRSRQADTPVQEVRRGPFCNRITELIHQAYDTVIRFLH